MQYYTNKATVLPKDDCVMRRCVDCTENLFPQRLIRTCTDEKGKSSSTKSSGSNHWIGIDDINTHWAGPIVIFLKTRLTCVAWPTAVYPLTSIILPFLKCLYLVGERRARSIMGVMDKSFAKVVQYYKPVANLTHQQNVMRLYRK